MPSLTSPANPLVKEVRRAVARGGLTPSGFCIAEGFHLLEEAVRSGCEIEAVLVSESAAARAGLKALVLADSLFRDIAATETSQGVIALVRPPRWDPEQLLRGNTLLVVLDGLQDPGNAGAIVRAAEAFQATGMVFIKGTVNPYNPKAVRGSAGSIFRVPLITGSEDRAAALLRGLDVYAAVPSAGTSLYEADLSRPCALIIGSEARGVRPALRAGATGLRIPTAGVESLNAAMAAGILLSEARRQRMGK